MTRAENIMFSALSIVCIPVMIVIYRSNNGDFFLVRFLVTRVGKNQNLHKAT